MPHEMFTPEMNQPRGHDRNKAEPDKALISECAFEIERPSFATLTRFELVKIYFFAVENFRSFFFSSLILTIRDPIDRFILTNRIK